MNNAPNVGQAAPPFRLRSVQGELVALESYRGRHHLILWFSRGISCPFCRSYMENVSAGYEQLRAQGIEVVQVAPNLLESARIFFRQQMPPYPFVCDPDKQLFAVYGLGDRGVLEATRNTIVSFSHAAAHGDLRQTVRGSWLDVANRNFIRRLHHHAMTAVEQGIFVVARDGVIRYRSVLGPLDAIPSAPELLRLSQAVLDG